MARGDDGDFADVPDRPSPVSLYPWVLIAWSAGSDTVGGKLHPAWLAAGGLVAFAVLYAAAIWLRWRTPGGAPRTSCLLSLAWSR